MKFYPPRNFKNFINLTTPSLHKRSSILPSLPTLKRPERSSKTTSFTERSSGEVLEVVEVSTDIKLHNQMSHFLTEWFGLHAGREVLQPTPKDRIFIEKVEDLISYIELCRGVGAPAWMSVQPFRTRGILFGLEKLFFDFDCEADPEKAWGEAHDFALKLKKYYGIQPLVAFSGRKGYHLYVFLWSTVQFQVHRQEVAKEVYSTLQEKLLKGLVYKTLDRQVIGDIKRLARIPYSIHEKTGRICQPLTLERQALWLDPKDLYVLRRRGISREFFEKVCKEVASAKRTMKVRRKVKFLGHNKVRPCIEAALQDPDLTHKMKVAIVAEYHRAGLSQKQIELLFQNRPDPDYKPHRTRYQVKHILRGGYMPFRCSTIRILGYCLREACPIFKKMRKRRSEWI
ncbi:MAG: DNA primase small subunit domain-containing protein [Candidatus Bathyarchaeia archaeon]